MTMISSWMTKEEPEACEIVDVPPSVIGLRRQRRPDAGHKGYVKPEEALLEQVDLEREMGNVE